MTMKNCGSKVSSHRPLYTWYSNGFQSALGPIRLKYKRPVQSSIHIHWWIGTGFITGSGLKPDKNFSANGAIVYNDCNAAMLGKVYLFYRVVELTMLDSDQFMC